MNETLRKLLGNMKVLGHEEYLRQLQAGGLLICMRFTEEGFASFSDNQTGECGMCEAPIFFRPYNAVAVNKVCHVCAPALIDPPEV